MRIANTPLAFLNGVMASENEQEAKNRALGLFKKIKPLKRAVMDEWIARIRKSVSSASQLSTPILTDTLPALFDHLASIFKMDINNIDASVLASTCATEHGNERARLTNYDINSLIQEYLEFRNTFLDILSDHEISLTEKEEKLVYAIFDTTIKEAVTTFVLVEGSFRERFVNALMHDMRGPLATAHMCLELISRMTDPQKISDIAERAKAQITRADTMIQELLNTIIFHKGERLVFQPVNFDLESLITEICEQAVFTYGKQLTVKSEPVSGWWGRDELKRGIENLVANAIKYGDSTKPITITQSTFNGRSIISVHNFGDPIPSEELENVYQAFYRATVAKESGVKGWGIGLSYVRSVAESHGGSIGAESTPDKGTTFVIDIPNDCRPFLNAPTLE